MIEGLEIPEALGYPILVGIVLAIAGFISSKALRNRPAPPSIAEMWGRIQTLESNQVASTARERTALTEAIKAKEETVELKQFVVEWISRLLAWDSAGRKGRMPLPTDEELSRLDITHPHPKEHLT